MNFVFLVWFESEDGNPLKKKRSEASTSVDRFLGSLEFLYATPYLSVFLLFMGSSAVIEIENNECQEFSIKEKYSQMFHRHDRFLPDLFTDFLLSLTLPLTFFLCITQSLIRRFIKLQLHIFTILGKNQFITKNRKKILLKCSLCQGNKFLYDCISQFVLAKSKRRFFYTFNEYKITQFSNSKKLEDWSN